MAYFRRRLRSTFIGYRRAVIHIVIIVIIQIVRLTAELISHGTLLLFLLVYFFQKAVHLDR